MASVSKMRAVAEEKGLSDMSLDEVNEIIRRTRAKRKARV